MLLGVGLLGGVAYYLYKQGAFKNFLATPQGLTYIQTQVDSFASKYPFAGRDLTPLQSLIPPLTAAQPPISS